MSAEQVSVIIPTYNRAALLSEAVDSVLAQRYTDHEIIVVDDGSTDDTERMVRERYGDGVRYLRQENRGVSAARNRGVEMARGRLVAFLDSDDLWLGEKLARMVPFMEKGRFGFAGHLTLLLKDGVESENKRACQAPGDDGSLDEPRRAIVEGKFFQTLSFVCTREVFEEAGGFREDFSAAEDTLFAWRASALTRVGLLEEFLSVYRVHEGQTDFESSGILRQRIEARKMMLASLSEDEGHLETPLRDFTSRSLFQYASALREEGHLLQGARAAAEAVKMRPAPKTFARYGLWWLGRDFRRRPFRQA